jgi:hypothetical protein
MAFALIGIGIHVGVGGQFFFFSFTFQSRRSILDIYLHHTFYAFIRLIDSSLTRFLFFQTRIR